MADMEQARALLSRARSDLESRQWDALDGKLTAAQRAFERFSRAAKASGQAAEVSRGAEGFVRAGRARTFAEALPRVGPLLAVLALLYPSSTASAEIDRRPEWVDAQQEYEVRLREISEASRQLMVELEAQPRPEKAPARAPGPQKQLASVPTQEDDPRCKPIPLPYHLGGHGLHNECADKMPNNSFPGGDVLVNGKNFDALQLVTRTLWDVKTDGFGKHDSRSQDFFIQMKLPEIQREKRLAEACGYEFAVGVRSKAHQIALERADGTLKVVLMNWC
ncbi:DUF6310 domain-containing protein [Archangium violaceum]|uniref:DUF6310 domain-containing protein n=1 Tax=Archangium violaceum TaxID=83451 RepID=UPI000698204F|nr:DUF6310 domain-containing protein [Archangium violaceum]